MRLRKNVFIVVLFFLLLFSSVYGEGSKEYNSDSRSSRNYISSNHTDYVYMKPGETLYVGTGLFSNEDWEIQIRTPTGQATAYNVTPEGNGFIANRAQELAGPKPLNNNGYNPIAFQAQTEGIYYIDYKIHDHSGYNTQLKANEDWNYNDLGTQNHIISWDATVVSSSGTKINGRVFMNVIDGYSGDWGPDIPVGERVSYASFYVLTDVGYQYKIYLNGSAGIFYTLRANSMGNMVNGRSAYVSYHSTQGTSYINHGFTTANRSDFSMGSDGNISYRIFYNKPNADLLSYLGLPTNGTPLEIKITDFIFTSNSGQTNIAVKNEGGKFSFNSNYPKGKYILTLKFQSGNNLVFSSSLKTNNTITWNGKDSAGTVVPDGEFTAELEIKPGETHIVLNDFEFIQNGIIFERLNGSAANRYNIHYDHSIKTIDGYSNGMDYITIMDDSCYITYPDGDGQCAVPLEPLIYQGGWMIGQNTGKRYLQGPLDRSSGVNSSSGTSASDNLFSNHKNLDFWSYDDAFEKISVKVIIVSTKSITINKYWDDGNTKLDLRPSSVTFDAFPGNSNTSAGNCTVSISNSWSCTINNLPIYDNSGNEIQYVIKERNAPKAYAADPVTVPSGGESVSITNKLVTKKIEISKKWAGDRDNLFETRPQQITFDAYWEDTVYGSCSTKAQDNWKCSIDNLPVYDGSGAAITYTIKERNVPNAYTADEPVISGENNKAGTLTNTLITKDISVNKAWEDQNNKYGGRPTNLKFDLYLGDEVKDSCTATADTSWKCTFSGLPVYDALGLELSYTIKENKVPDGYSTEDVVVSGKDAKTASIINKLITRDITVIKNWTDNNDHDRKRPQSIVLKLYQDGELFSTVTLTAAENTLSKNVWTYVFQDIPKYNKDGEAAVYSIKEFPAN